MKPFNSFMADYFEQYIAYRRGLGYSEKILRYDLGRFDTYLLEKQAVFTDLSSMFFLQMKKDYKANRSTFNHLLRILRGLFAYLVRRQIIGHNPLTDIGAYRQNAYIPFLFSADQTEQLLVAIEKRIRKNPNDFLIDYGRSMAIVLMARCGLRISEPLRLKYDDYDTKRKTIYIQKTKFNKDRLIPLAQNAWQQLDNYLAVRNSFCVNSPYLIAGRRGGLRANFIRKAFHQAAADIGCVQKKHVIANTSFGRASCHSLRHSFAVNTLLRIKDREQSPQHALPVLSSYMGHRKYRYTAVYLKVLDAKHRKNLVDFAISKQAEL